MDLAERIRTIRKDRQMSQEDLARRAEMSLRAFRSLERGEAVDPHYSTLSGIARALDISIAELIGEPVLAGPKAEAPGGAEDDYEAPEYTDDEITRVAEGIRESVKHPEVVNVIESLEVTAEHVEYVLKRGRYDLKEIWHLVGTARAVYADYRARRKRLLESLRDSAPRLHELLQQADARMKSARDAVIGAYDARLEAEKDKAQVAEVDELEKRRQRKRADREDLAERSA